MLILSCDPDEAKKKPTTPNTQDKDDKSNKPEKPTKPADKPNKPEKPLAPINSPVVSLGTISSQTAVNDGGTDASDTVWVFQNKEITFSTTAKDKDDREIPNAPFTWEWRKRGQDTDRGFGHIWTEIPGQTTKTATLPILADERVGAYELRISATSGKETVNNHKKTPYKFTVRKSGCLPPSTTNQPADLAALKEMVTGDNALLDKDIPAIDTSLVTDMLNLFKDQKNFNGEINCWDVSNVTSMGSIFGSASSFNQNIGDWDVSNVENMNTMFLSAKAFNNGNSPSIGNWDVSKAKGMSGIFANASAFNQDLSGWDVANISSSNRLLFDYSATTWERRHKPKFR